MNSVRYRMTWACSSMSAGSLVLALLVGGASPASAQAQFAQMADEVTQEIVAALGDAYELAYLEV